MYFVRVYVVNCVFVCGAHRCGTTFVPAEEKAAITPDSKRAEDALFGTTRKRCELHLHDINNILTYFILILIVLLF